MSPLLLLDGVVDGTWEVKSIHLKAKPLCSTIWVRLWRNYLHWLQCGWMLPKKSCPHVHSRCAQSKLYKLFCYKDFHGRTVRCHIH